MQTIEELKQEEKMVTIDVETVEELKENEQRGSAEPTSANERRTRRRRAVMCVPGSKGVWLIAIGAIFLLSNAFSFINWLALLLLIPVARLFRRGSHVWAVVLGTVTAILLFGLSWDLLLPVLLIAVGTSVLVGRMRPVVIS